MIRDDTIERYTFHCPRCGARRARSYEARHVTDAGGHTWDSYKLNGNPAMAPTGRGAVICLECGVAMHAYHVGTRRQQDDEATAPATERIDAAQAAHTVAAGIESLLTAARAPRQHGFTRLDDLNEVISAIQGGLDRLPLLLHELGLTLDHARAELFVHGPHHDDVVTAVRALYGAANTASELAEPLVDRLDRARAAIASLDGALARTGDAQR